MTLFQHEYNDCGVLTNFSYHFKVTCFLPSTYNVLQVEAVSPRFLAKVSFPFQEDWSLDASCLLLVA